MDIGTEVMLRYLQSWGQSVEEKISTLNKAAKAAGLRAEWRQDADGKNAGWYGQDCERAAEFKTRLHQVWCGEFTAEASAVEALIAEFAAHAQEA